MTERWHRELRKLRDLTPDRDLWERIEFEPRPTPAMARAPLLSRWIAALAALAIAGAGIALVIRAFQGEVPRRAASTSQSNGKIAFTSQRERSTGYFEVYVVNPDGTGMSNVSNTTADIADIAWEWSPDGTQLAFVVDTGDEQLGYDIYVMSADGTGRMDLTSQPGDESSPAWSSDGSRIAFVEDYSDGTSDIRIMNPDGSEQVKLTDTTGSPKSPIWSPDGSQIAFTRNTPGGSSIYVVRSDGTAEARLTDGQGFDQQPAWSPDGSKIAFSSDRDGEVELYVMNADGTDQTRLTKMSTDEPDCCLGQPTWSPDGVSLAFAALEGGDWDIYVVNADGGGLRDVTTAPGDEISPTWSPDGTLIAFAGSPLSADEGENGGTFDIYIITPDGTEEDRLTTDAQALGGRLTWQPLSGEG
jgi:TolB protein